MVDIFNLKKKVKAKGPNATVGKPKDKKANLKVDGKWGNATTRALQVYLNTVVDGKISDQVRNSITEAFYGDTLGPFLSNRMLQKRNMYRVQRESLPALMFFRKKQRSRLNES